MGEINVLEIDVAGIQNNWTTFPTATWTNNLGYDIAVTCIVGKLAGSQSMVGETALWLYFGNAWPPSGRGLYSWGAEVYTPPSQPLLDRQNFNAGDQITIPNGTTIGLTTNSGPVNLPGGGTSAPFNYTAVAQLYYKKAGT